MSKETTHASGRTLGLSGRTLRTGRTLEAAGPVRTFRRDHRTLGGSTPAFASGVAWDRRAMGARGVAWGAAAIIAAATLLAATATDATATAKRSMMSVLVMETPGAGNAPERAVASLGGKVTRQLPVINGFAAEIPASAVAKLRRTYGVKYVTPNQKLRAHGLLPGSSYSNDGTMSSLYSSIRVLGAQKYWQKGYTGKGIDVALIDTGVTRVPGLDAPGKVIDGPDLSFDSQDPARRYKDFFGHGTHLAGIIAGNDRAGATGSQLSADSTSFIGIAPDARIVNMKVGDGNGVTDVTQVIAAIDWVVQNRNINGMNIKVLELAFGTDATGHMWQSDPLAFATEVAMNNGIMVVTAAGNTGKKIPGPGIVNPAFHPRIISVGASDSNNTQVAEDDSVAPFSSSAAYWGGRGPDLLAPGVSIPSLTAPGSITDTLYSPYAGVGTRFIKGSGTSQSSALIAGAAALIVQQRPTITHNKLKGTLVKNSKSLLNEPIEFQGAGVAQIDWVYSAGTAAGIKYIAGTGNGSLDRSRGSNKPERDGVALTGEVDIFGNTFNSTAWAKAAAAKTSWSNGGSSWNGSAWTGSSWTGSSWNASSWTGRGWSGRAWSASTWNGSAWNGSSWSGSSWSGRAWGGSGWSTAGWR